MSFSGFYDKKNFYNIFSYLMTRNCFLKKKKPCHHTFFFKHVSRILINWRFLITTMKRRKRIAQFPKEDSTNESLCFLMFLERCFFKKKKKVFVFCMIIYTTRKKMMMITSDTHTHTRIALYFSHLLHNTTVLLSPHRLSVVQPNSYRYCPLPNKQTNKKFPSTYLSVLFFSSYHQQRIIFILLSVV